MELESNPLHVPVACAAFKLTTVACVCVCLGTVSIDAKMLLDASGLWMSRQFIRNPLGLI